MQLEHVLDAEQLPSKRLPFVLDAVIKARFGVRVVWNNESVNQMRSWKQTGWGAQATEAKARLYCWRL